MTGLDNVTNVFIGNGAALVNATQFSLSAFTSTGALAVVKGSDMKTTNLAYGTETAVYIAQKKSATDLKKSFVKQLL